MQCMHVAWVGAQTRQPALLSHMQGPFERGGGGALHRTPLAFYVSFVSFGAQPYLKVQAFNCLLGVRGSQAAWAGRIMGHSGGCPSWKRCPSAPHSPPPLTTTVPHPHTPTYTQTPLTSAPPAPHAMRCTGARHLLPRPRSPPLTPTVPQPHNPTTPHTLAPSHPLCFNPMRSMHRHSVRKQDIDSAEVARLLLAILYCIPAHPQHPHTLSHPLTPPALQSDALNASPQCAEAGHRQR